MLTFTGRGSTQTCDGITRRDFLQAGVLGAVGLSLPNLMALKALGKVAEGHDERSCIMIFNLGAPSQIDLFDPKPDAPSEIRGPFNAISTKSKDIQLTELLPQHAKLADKFSVVRSCYHTAAAVHDTGHQMMQTGRLFTGGVNTPHAGRATSCRRTSSCPRRWAPPAGTCRTGRTRDFLGRGTTRSCSTPTRPSRI